MENKDRKIFKKENVGLITTFSIVFGVSCFAAYKVTSGKTVKSELKPIKTEFNGNNYDSEDTHSYFGDFSTKVLGYLDEDNEETLGLKGSFENFSVSYPTKDGLMKNNITVNGDINILMNTLSDLDLTIDLGVKYNNKDLDLALGFVDNDAYFVLNDLKIKSSYDSTMDILEYVYQSFLDPENENGLGLNFDIEDLITDIVGKIDMSSLDLSAISTTEKDVGENVIISLNISDIALDLTVRKSDLALLRVDLGTINIGDVTIAGALNFDTIDKVLKLDDPEYPKQRGEFTEVISYIGWVDELLDLFQTRSLGLDLNAQINLIGDEDKTLLADITSKVNLNCKDVFDFNNLNINEMIQKASKDEFEIGDLFNLDKLEFDFDLVTKGQLDEEYANINLSYFDKAAYLALNENADSAVMKAKLNNETLSEILEAVPNLVSAIEGLKEEVPEEDIKEASDGIFDFITSSALVKGIKNNDFSGILDVIKSIRNDNDKIYLDLDLSSLGLGNDAVVNLVLNASKDENAKVLSIDVKNIVVSSVEINLNLKTSEFSGEKIAHVKEIKDTYDDLSFVPGVINQTSEILNEQKGKLIIDGTILDDSNEGITINGVAQFDAKAKVGYGSINMRERSSKIVNSNKYLDHKIDFDINNNGENDSDKNALFVYNSELKAKFTLQTFIDIIDLGKDLLNSDDERFTKFGDLISESLLTGTLKEIISSKDYLRLAKSSFIKSIKQENGGNTIRVVIGGDVLGMDSDLNVLVNFKEADGTKKLSSLSVSGIKVKEKNIAVTIGLEDFDNSFVSPVNKTDKFMDFSQVKVLLDFGINTTKINYYHLTAKASLKISVLSAVKVDLDFHIHVDGKKTRVYGSIPKVPWITDIASGHIATTSVDTEFVFEPTEDVGGVFHIVRNENHLIAKDEVIYYQSDSKNYIENILQYLLVDMLDIRESISDAITNSSGSTEKEYDPNYAKMFTKTGFNYTKNSSTGQNVWRFGLNMDQLLGNDTLGALEVSLTGKDLETSGLFTKASVSLDILSFLTVEADIDLVNPSFEVETWPSNIETKYNKVLSWYNNLSSAKKADFDENYKNKPLKGYTMVSKYNYL